METVVVSPLREISDVSSVADKRRPAGFHNVYCMVDLNGKQHVFSSFPLLCQRSFNFLLHPLAGDRMFGQNQKQLVVDMNDLVNAASDPIADLQVLGCVPTDTDP